MAKVTMPQLGESVAEGTIGKWLKKPGDTVAKYEPLLEVITDKVNAEVPSPFAGVLREILVEEGATVPNNAEIAVIETADEGEAAAAGAPAPAAPVATEKQAAPSEPDPGGAAVEVRQPAGSSNGPAGSDERRTEEMPDRAAAAAGAKAPSATAPTAGVAAGGAPAIEAAAAASAVTETGAAGNADARMTPAVRRGEARLARRRLGCGRRCRLAGRCGRRLGGRSLGGLRVARVGARVFGRLDHRDLGVVRNRGAFLDEDLREDARERRRHLGIDLVGDDLEQRLVLLDGVAWLLEPLADRPLGDALAELGHRHLGHWSFLRVAGRIEPAITCFGT